MFQKICNYAALVSLVLTTSVIGTGYFGYKYVTSPQFQAKIKNKLMGEIKNALPKVVDNSLPSMTGPALPF